MRLFTLLFCLLLCACATKEVDPLAQKKGELRRQLFVECMELAAKNSRQGDDDVSDLVDSCNQHSNWLLNTYFP